MNFYLLILNISFFFILLTYSNCTCLCTICSYVYLTLCDMASSVNIMFLWNVITTLYVILSSFTITFKVNWNRAAESFIDICSIDLYNYFVLLVTCEMLVSSCLLHITSWRLCNDGGFKQSAVVSVRSDNTDFCLTIYCHLHNSPGCDSW